MDCGLRKNYYNFVANAPNHRQNPHIKGADKKFLLVDGHAVMRAGTRLILQDVWAGIIFDEAGGGDEALRKVHDNDYDVVLMGLMLPDIHGFEVLRGMKREKPGLPVIIVSLHDEERYAVKAYSL